jgi:hypothetical protein
MMMMKKMMKKKMMMIENHHDEPTMLRTARPAAAENKPKQRPEADPNNMNPKKTALRLWRRVGRWPRCR